MLLPAGGPSIGAFERGKALQQVADLNKNYAPVGSRLHPKDNAFGSESFCGICSLKMTCVDVAESASVQQQSLRSPQVFDDARHSQSGVPSARAIVCNMQDLQ